MPNLLIDNPTVQNVISIAETYISKHNISSAKLNCELLLCEILKISRLDLRINANQTLTVSQFQQFENYIERRASNEPLQYIIGFVDFYNIRLKINKSALIPRPETEYLIAFIANSQIKPNKILDICSGSGCISLSLAKLFGDAVVDAIDISLESIELATENQKNLGLENVNFIHCDIQKYFENKKLEKYDLIVCNPPYVTSEDYNKLEPELFFEPSIALTDGADGLTFYKLISSNIHKILARNGKLYFECGINQAEKICKIYENIGFQTQIIQDFAKINRFVCIY